MPEQCPCGRNEPNCDARWIPQRIANARRFRSLRLPVRECVLDNNASSPFAEVALCSVQVDSPDYYESLAQELEQKKVIIQPPQDEVAI